MIVEFIAERFNYAVVIVLMMTGLYVLFSTGNLVKKLVGLTVFQTSVFLLYISIGKVAGGQPPILEPHYGDGHAEAGYEETVSHGGDDASVGGHTGTMDEAAEDQPADGHAPMESAAEGDPEQSAEAAAESIEAAGPQADPAADITPQTGDPAPTAVETDSAEGLEADIAGDADVPQLADPEPGAEPETDMAAAPEDVAEDILPVENEAVLYSNPLPHVLILTAIVVGVATLSVGLALVVRIREVYGTIEDDAISRADYETMAGTS